MTTQNPFYKKYQLGPLRILHSISKMKNASKWHHVSVSCEDRLPTWEEMKIVKEKILGDVEAVHTLPNSADYVNLHSYCLHIWSPIGFAVGIPNLVNIIDEVSP